MKYIKLSIFISSLLFVSFPLLTSATPKAHQYMTSFIRVSNSSADASLVSHGPGSYYKIGVCSEIRNSGVTIKRHESVSHSGKYGSKVSALGLGPNASARNGSKSGSSWEYYYTNGSIWY